MKSLYDYHEFLWQHQYAFCWQSGFHAVLSLESLPSFMEFPLNACHVGDGLYRFLLSCSSFLVSSLHQLQRKGPRVTFFFFFEAFCVWNIFPLFLLCKKMLFNDLRCVCVGTCLYHVWRSDAGRDDFIFSVYLIWGSLSCFLLLC